MMLAIQLSNWTKIVMRPNAGAMAAIGLMVGFRASASAMMDHYGYREPMAATLSHLPFFQDHPIKVQPPADLTLLLFLAAITTRASLANQVACFRAALRQLRL